ncbi:MAG TPA: hypothetical protein VF638_05590 [Sphingomonas sp.]|jgi:hypothetical protein
MSELLDLLTGAQDATIALLRAQLPEAQRGMARHSLDEDAKPPFHLVGDVDVEPAGGKGEQADKVTVDLHTVYKGTDRGELLALMHQVRLATDDKQLTVEGGTYRFEWLGAVASTAASDGVTYAGITQLEILAEPA